MVCRSNLQESLLILLSKSPQGLLGLGLDGAAHSDANTPFHNLAKLGLLARPVFGVLLVDGQGGVLTLGGIEHAHYRGDLK